MRTGSCKIVFCCAWRSYVQLPHLKEKYVNKFSRTARSVTFAAIVGLSLGVAGPGMVAAPAYAQVVNKANIDFQKVDGSITVNKILNPTKINDPIADGNTLTEEQVGQLGGKKAQGISFTATKIDMKLTNNEEFQALVDAVEAARATGYKGLPLSSGVKVMETNEQGQAKFTGLAVGAYLVEEGAVNPNNTNLTKDEQAGLAPSKPFVVFVPMTNPRNRTEWNYNPQVFPKNSSAQITKKVEDKTDYKVGDSVAYTIDSTIPAPADGKKLFKYIVKDTPDEKLTYTPESAKLQIKPASGAGTVELIGKTDYNETIGGDRQISWTFTEEGLKKLVEAGLGAKVVTTLEAKLENVGESNGDYVNRTDLTFNNFSDQESDDKEVPGNEVVTKMAKLKILKKGEGDDAQKLNGAVFELYRCTDKKNLLGAKLNVGGQDSWTTTGDGTFTIDGLKVSDWANGAKVDSEYKYCLVETTAPKGYELLPEPVEIEFTEEAAHVDSREIAMVSKEIKNVKDVTPNLPMTGGAGVGILAAIGAAIIGAGAWFARRNSAES